MADRYWVGGAGTWNTTSTTNWSTTSGGSGGASVPTSADNVIFDQVGPYTVTVDGLVECLSLTVSAASITFTKTNAQGIDIYGSLTISSGPWFSATNCILTFKSTTSGNTISASGITLRGLIYFDGVGGEWALQSNIDNAGFGMNLSNGALNINGYTYTCNNITSSVTTTRSIAMGGGVIELRSGTTTINATNFSMSGGGTIRFITSSTKTFSGGGYQDYPTFDQAGSGTLTIAGSNGFANFTNTYSSTGATTIQFTSGTTSNFDAFNITGTVGKVCTLGATTTSTATLVKSSPWYVGANSTDSGNNIGLTFTAGGGIDYLNISYIRGADLSGTGNFLAFF